MSDFDLFKEEPIKSSPIELDQKVKGQVYKALTPKPFSLFLKLISLHGIVGFLTMLFCPQFDMSLTNNHEVFHYLHHNFGAQICMFICGMIFLGTGSLISASFIRIEEMRAIHRHNILYPLGLSSTFLFFFFAFGAEIYLKMTLFWVLGAILSSIIFFEAVRFARIKIFYPGMQA